MKLVLLVLFIITINVDTSRSKNNEDLIQNYTKVEEVILLDSTFSNYREILPKIIDNNIFVLNHKPISNSTSYVFHLHKYGNEHQIYSVVLANDMFDKREWIYDFHYSDSLLVLLLFDRVIVLKQRDSIFSLIKDIDLPKPAHRIYHDDNNYIFTFAGTEHNKKREVFGKTYLIKYDDDFSEHEIIDYKIPRGLQWTNIRPRILISYHKKSLLLFDADRYRFRKFDHYNKIELDTLLSDRLSLVRMRSIVDRIDGATDMLDLSTRMSLIRTVHFIDSNTFLLSWTSKNDSNSGHLYKVWFDIWQKRDEQWTLDAENLSNISFDSNDIYDPNNEFIDRFWISEGKIISIVNLSEEYDPDKNMTHSEIQNKFQECINNNSPRYSILVRSLIIE